MQLCLPCHLAACQPACVARHHTSVRVIPALSGPSPAEGSRLCPHDSVPGQSSVQACADTVSWGAGEPEEDGYEDQYQLEDADITAADYVVPVAVSNWR